MKSQAIILGLLLLASASSFAGGKGVVALQSADASCSDDTGNIYVDCGNGTVTDTRTGLVWLKNASCLGAMTDWITARDFVAGLSDLDDDFCTDEGEPSQALCDCGLSDGSSPGEWRLPTAYEWKIMISDALGMDGDPNCTLSPPTLTNDSGLGCQISGPSSFYGVIADAYWTINLDLNPASSGKVWAVDLNDGQIYSSIFKEALLNAWPVRGGQ